MYIIYIYIYVNYLDLTRYEIRVKNLSFGD